MDLKEIYTSLEDKWYAFLDSLDAKGIPVYKIIDPIENAGIPSLPLFAGLIILIILGIWYASLGGGGPGVSGTILTVNVIDMNTHKGLEGASISVIAGDTGEKIASAITNPEGIAKLRLPSNQAVQISLSKEGCEPVSKSIRTGEISTITLQTQCTNVITPTTCLGLSPNLETIALMTPEGYPAQDCNILVKNSEDPTDTLYVDWFVDGDGNLHLSEPSTCPSANESYIVEIDCANAKYEASWDEFLDDIKMGTITMESKFDDPHTNTTIPSENTVSIPVYVKSMDGTPLMGMIVKAVDEEGNDLDTGVSGVVTEAQTDSTGTAILVLPNDQAFYVHVEDPNGAYYSKIVGSNDNPFYASAFLAMSGISIILERGFPTKIYVKEEATQTPVIGAIVTVKYEGKVVASPESTDSQGLATFTLISGKNYTVEVRHPKYGVKTAQVTGGDNITVWMETVDLSKVGNLDIHVRSAHGMEEPMANVVIELMKGNVTYARSKTNDAGLVKFTQIEEGDYTIRALPPGGVTYQNMGTVHVEAGNTTQVDLSVVPTQIKITVIPLICIHPDKCVPKENVHVELWNSWLEEKINETETGRTRKAVFTVDYGTPYFVVASWVDPETKKKFGPVTYRPSSPAFYSQEIQFKVGEVTDKAEIWVNLDDLVPGAKITPGKHKAYVTVTLPEFSPGTHFKEVDIEMFTGEPGRLSDISRTPIAIDYISLVDISTQDPQVVDLFKADEYYYGKEPKKDDNGLSKYIRIVLGSYKDARAYTAEIPVYVRKNARGLAKINYRATWITPDGRKIQSNEGLWESINYTIASQQTGDIPLEAGPFYTYNAWLTSTKNGAPKKTVTITNGSYVYLHFRARARDDVSNWIVDLKSIPEKLRPVAFEGWIERSTGNKTFITQMDLRTWQIKNTQDLYALKKDDVLEGIVTLEALAPGKASIVLFRDVEHPLGVKISEVPVLQKETPVAGVTGKISASWKSLDDPKLTGQIDIRKDVLPTDNKIFWLDLELDNKDNSSKTITVLVQALDNSINFTSVEMDRHVIPGSKTYIEEFDVDLNGNEEKKIRVNGIGYSSSMNQMGVFIYEKGTPKPNKPWVIINYGPVNFKLVYRTLRDGEELPFPMDSANEVDVKVIKNVNGQQTSLTDLVTVRVNGKLGELTEDYFKATFDRGIGRSLTITAKSDYFGELSESPDVAFVDLKPEYPNAIDFTHPLPLLNQEETRYLNITNYFPVTVHFSVGDASADGWEINIEPRVYAMNTTSRKWEPTGNITDKSNIAVGPMQKLVIAIRAKPVDIVCRNFQNPILEIKSSDALPEPLGYGLKLKCNSTGGVIPGNITVMQSMLIRRDPTPPKAITQFSCSYIKEYNVSYLCDAEQLAIAIARAADALMKDPSVYSVTYTYAFGNDKLTQAAFEEAIKKVHLDKISNVFETRRQAELSSGHDIVFNARVTCGYVTVTLTKFNMDKDVEANVTVKPGEWCSYDNNSYLIGLMNYDRDIRPLFGKYYSFDENGDNAEIFKAIEIAKSAGNNVTASAMFGYGVDGVDPDEIVSEITGGQAQSFIKWKTCSLDQGINCPGFAVNYLKQHPDYGVIGYMRINQYNDIYLGLVYDKEKIPESMLDRYKALFITRLMSWAIEGKTSGLDDQYNTNAYWIYVPKNDRNASQVIDVVGPNVTDVEVMWTDELGAIHTDFAGDLNVTVRITADKTAKFCYVANVMPDGTFTGPKGEGKPGQTNNVISSGNNFQVFELSDWQLIPGLGIKRVAAYCVDNSGVSSPVAMGVIKLDTSGVELVGRLPDTILMFEPFKKDAFTFKVMSRYTGVTSCWLEWPNDTSFNGQAPQPTEGHMNAISNENVCANEQDENHNGNLSDGCCYISGAGTGEIKNAIVNITGEITGGNGVYNVSVGATVRIYNATKSLTGKLSEPITIISNKPAYIYMSGKAIRVPGTSWTPTEKDNKIIAIKASNVDVSWSTATEGFSIYNYFDVICNSVVIPEGQYNKYIPVKVVCENAAGVRKTLGEVRFYEYAPGAPQIFLPSVPFSMGWVQWENGPKAITLDQPLIQGTSFYCNATDGNCEIPAS